MKGTLKGVAIVFGILAALLILTMNFSRFPPSNEGAVPAERETMNTAIRSMMVDKDLSQVRASTSGHGGEKIDATSAQFHPTFNLWDYMDQAATYFCYRWDADGRITFQFDVNADGNCAVDAKQLFP